MQSNRTFNIIWSDSKVAEIKHCFHSYSTGACLMLSHNNVRPFVRQTWKKRPELRAEAGVPLIEFLGEHQMKTTFQG